MLQAQDRQTRLYNRGTRLRQFMPGDKVLVLLPTSSSKLLANWQGPFVVTRRVGELDYEVKRTDRGDACQIYHLNLLKRWNEGTLVGLAAVVSNEDDLGPEAALKNHPFALVSGGDHLSPRQLTDLAQLQADFADVFSPLPGRTDLVQHHIETLPGEVARSRPYRLPEHKKNVVQEELKAMLNLGVIEESHSDWASPIVLVPKTDGSVRFCVDYRKVNAVSKFDAYPMPQVDELLDRLGAARFYSTLDLTKGYWQIPLSPLSKEKTAFTTPFGLHQFVTLPFGLFGLPPPSSASWTKSSGPAARTPLPIWMISSSIVMIGSGIWNISAWSWGRWGWPGSRQTHGSVQLGGWRYSIWASTWAMGRCVPKLIRRRQLRPAQAPRPKKRWDSSWGWRDIIGGLFLIFRTSPKTNCILCLITTETSEAAANVNRTSRAKAGVIVWTLMNMRQRLTRKRRIVEWSLFYRCPYYLSGPWTCQLHCGLCKVRKLSDFIKSIFICVTKTNEDLTC